jgi:formate dehydrogenase iron-sulfur subunit
MHVAWHSPQYTDVLSLVALPLAKLLITTASIKIITEAFLFIHLHSRQMTALKKSAILMTSHLRPWTMQRFMYGIAGGIILPALLLVMHMYWTPAWTLGWVLMIAVMNISAEMLERYLFFRAVVPLKMPH